MKNKENHSANVVNFQEYKFYRGIRNGVSNLFEIEEHYKIKVLRPGSLDDAEYIIELIKNEYIVMLNLSDISIQDAQRFTDIIHGACYSLENTFHIISNNVIIAGYCDLTDFENKHKSFF